MHPTFCTVTSGNWHQLPHSSERKNTLKIVDGLMDDSMYAGIAFAMTVYIDNRCFVLFLIILQMFLQLEWSSLYHTGLID